MMNIGEFHCTCRFYRAEEFGPAKLIEDSVCGFHAAMRKREKGWNEAIRAAIQMAQTATATRDGITVRASSEQVALLLETLLIDVPSTGDNER